MESSAYPGELLTDPLTDPFLKLSPVYLTLTLPNHLEKVPAISAPSIYSRSEVLEAEAEESDQS